MARGEFGMTLQQESDSLAARRESLLTQAAEARVNGNQALANQFLTYIEALKPRAEKVERMIRFEQAQMRSRSLALTRVIEPGN
jgi:phage shock protein A